MWAQVWNIILLVILLTALQVPIGEEEIKKKKKQKTTNHAHQNNNKNVKTLQKEKE